MMSTLRSRLRRRLLRASKPPRLLVVSPLNPAGCQCFFLRMSGCGPFVDSARSVAGGGVARGTLSSGHFLHVLLCCCLTALSQHPRRCASTLLSKSRAVPVARPPVVANEQLCHRLSRPRLYPILPDLLVSSSPALVVVSFHVRRSRRSRPSPIVTARGRLVTALPSLHSVTALGRPVAALPSRPLVIAGRGGPVGAPGHSRSSCSAEHLLSWGQNRTDARHGCGKLFSRRGRLRRRFTAGAPPLLRASGWDSSALLARSGVSLACGGKQHMQ